MAAALGLACAAAPPPEPGAPRAKTPNVYVPASCPGATQLEWPVGPNEDWTLVVFEPGCVRIEHPPVVASTLRARCVRVDDEWNVIAQSDWVEARRASDSERARLCQRR